MKFFINKPTVKRRHYISVPVAVFCLVSPHSFADNVFSEPKTAAPNTVSAVTDSRAEASARRTSVADASPKTSATGREMPVPLIPVAKSGSGKSGVPQSPTTAPSITPATSSSPQPTTSTSTSPSTSAATVAPPAAPVSPATPAAPAAPVGRTSAALPPSRDSQPAMDALQAMNPSGWTATPLKIYLPGIDPAAGSTSSVSSSPALSVTMSEDVQKAASNAPQFMPFDQLGSEVDAQRVAILREFRCISVYTKSYKRGQRLITARVYTFDSPECACGAYSLLHQGASTVVRRGDGSSEDDQGISFWQGRTFVSVYGTSADDDESKEVVRTIADKFSSVLKEHAGLPPILDQLPKLDRVKGSERIVMGTLSARRFSPAPYLNYLDFSHASEAATADYQIQSPPDRLKLLYVDYRYPGWAAAAYRTYTQQFSGRAVAFDEPVIGETCMYKVNGTFILCQQVGGHLAIISGARKKQSASQLARFLH